MTDSDPADFVTDETSVGARLDAFLAAQLPQFSRVQLRRAITAGEVLVDNRPAKPAYRLQAGQAISVILPRREATGPEPEDIPLDILFEDDHLVAVNKPPAMVVHPAKGHWSGTLASALAFHFEHLSSVGGATRPGIVHRLDRDTSGVIVVAKTDEAHLRLAAQFEARTTEKEYFAIVAGTPEFDRGVIEKPIGMHPYQREKMAIREGHSTSRDARSVYEVVERWRGFAIVRVLPKTGRTHQIRVHMAHLGCPVLCDRLYGGRSQITLGELQGEMPAGDVVLARHALHAQRLKLKHPISQEEVEFCAPLPADLSHTCEQLRQLR
ncbi:MAG: RNA pseudouridine synthase [Blastopirellula sp.]|nr:RNA pseudouridine synthase [Blastopirellula sp.]